MPNGLKFQRKHRFWGYKLKYLYYCIARRDRLTNSYSDTLTISLTNNYRLTNSYRWINEKDAFKRFEK